MSKVESLKLNISNFKGKNRRLLHEWQKIESRFANDPAIEVYVDRTNAAGLPTAYWVKYHISCICRVRNISRLGEPGVENSPVFDNYYTMTITLPENFPDLDGAPVFKFDTLRPNGLERPTPWHPNIRFFGPMKGLVCLNRTDTFGDIADSIERIADYLRYKLYHADLTPPFPEDLKVAQWVREQGEPNDWLTDN